MEVIKANKNKEHNSFNFNELNKEFEKILSICYNCKFFDNETETPIKFCDKSSEMIDYWFCTSKCPLKKFKLEDKNEKKNNDTKKRQSSL